jgi:hypothetical protein
MENDDEKNRLLALARKNSPSKADYAREIAFSCLSDLAVNLLRILGGAGKPETLLSDIDKARSAYVDYLQTARADGQILPEPASSGLDIDTLFKSEIPKPATEEEWQRWARDDPYRDYLIEREYIKLSLRRSVLREIAAELAGVQVQSRRYSNEIDDAIHRIIRAKETLDQQESSASVSPRRKSPSVPVMPVSTPPVRVAIAEQAIADIRRAKRDNEIACLDNYQIAGLRAVQAGSAEALALVNSFTLDVLGHMGLLVRAKGGKGKAAWQLTDDGRLALERHAPNGASLRGSTE